MDILNRLRGWEQTEMLPLWAARRWRSWVENKGLLHRYRIPRMEFGVKGRHYEYKVDVSQAYPGAPAFNMAIWRRRL